MSTKYVHEVGTRIYSNSWRKTRKRNSLLFKIGAEKKKRKKNEEFIENPHKMLEMQMLEM